MPEQNRKQAMAQADGLIKAGRIKEAALLLADLQPSAFTRLENLEFAKLQRRTGLADQSLRALAPYVRPKHATPVTATDEEKAEYAISLQRAGSLAEAREVLAQTDPARAPEALLYAAVFMFSEWNYRDAIPVLRRLIALSDKDSYLQRVAQVNLAAALTLEAQTLEAGEMLGQLRDATAAHHEYLLLSNVCEISAQLHIQKRDFAAAAEDLQSAQAQLSGVKVLDYLWLVKWKGILQALQEGRPDALDAVKAEAVRKRHWETLREIDFYRLQVAFDPAVYTKLYFGTGSAHYRRRLLDKFPQAPLPDQITAGPGWSLSVQDGVDLFSGLHDELAPGTIAHAALILFLSDWYREFRAGELHTLLFKGDYFNPDTSLNRVHQAVARVRKAIETRLPGVTIDINDSVYALRVGEGPTRLLIPKDRPPPQPLAIRLYILQAKLGAREFNGDDVQTALGLSKSSANKLLKQWREEKLVAKLENGLYSGTFKT